MKLISFRLPSQSSQFLSKNILVLNSNVLVPEENDVSLTSCNQISTQSSSHKPSKIRQIHVPVIAKSLISVLSVKIPVSWALGNSRPVTGVTRNTRSCRPCRNMWMELGRMWTEWGRLYCAWLLESCELLESMLEWVRWAIPWDSRCLLKLVPFQGGWWELMECSHIRSAVTP